MFRKKTEKSKVSLVVTTYNWPLALKKCLESIMELRTMPGEVIVADDGSREETKELIDLYKAKFPIPLIHVWQPDEGFQLAKIRNRAFAATSGEYIIQVDGDLILHPYFIEDHIRIAQRGFFITGSRVILNEGMTGKILDDSFKHDTGLRNKKNTLNGMYSFMVQRLLSRVYKTAGRNKFYVKGCNMSFWKNDLIKVNGYNESFIGWGREDSELAIRLINAGVKKKFLKMGGIVYHLYHKEASRSYEQANVDLMNAAVQQKITWCERGLNQYL